MECWVAGTVMLLEGNTSSTKPDAVATTPEKNHIIKKRRQGGEDGECSEIYEEAASLEDRRAK